MTTRQIARLTGAAGSHLHEVAWAMIPPELARKAKPHVARFGDALFTAMEDSASQLMNRVTNLGVERRAREEIIDRILDYAKTARVKRFGFYLTPGPQSDQIAGWLVERGFRLHSGHSKLFRAAAPPPRAATDLTVRRIGPRHAHGFGEIIRENFGWPESRIPWLAAGVGRPGFHHYMAFDGARPVAGGLLYALNECGLLAMGATSPRYRRRGAQSALIAARVRHAGRLGCCWVASETVTPAPGRPSVSYRNLLRHGFKHVYDIPIYIWEQN